MTAVEIMDLFAALNRDGGVTFVISTHDPKVASYAGRRLYLGEGELLDVPLERMRHEASHHA